jgi:ATP-dependent Clp protease ATP-binding subunit ClpX
MTDLLKCAFCHKTQKQVSKLLAGMDENIYICNKCVYLSHGILDKEDKTRTLHEKKRKLRDVFDTVPPKQVHEYLNEHVIGQEQVKKSISVAIYNHCKRIFNDTSVTVQKSNVLLLGPTGVGKTLIAQSLASLMDVPFVITDATTITESGYAGDDAEVLIHKLFQNSDYDIARTEIGIIYVDEIDKKAKRNDMVSLSRDVSGEGVQQSLLKLMEGTVISVPNKHGRNPEKIDINTENILFIVGGAFIGLDNVVEQRMGKSKIGFTGALANKDYIWEDNIETSDLVQYGLIPEFLGRLPSVNVLHALSKEDLVRVLTEPKNSIVKQYQSLFELDNVMLEFKPDALTAIAEISIKQELGARGLRKIIDNALVNTQYELPDLVKQGVHTIIISEENITKGTIPHMVKGSISEK